MTKQCYIEILRNCFLGEGKMKTREHKRMVKCFLLLFYFFKITLFEHMSKKSARSFFGAWSFLLVHIRFEPGKGPKDFVNWVFMGERSSSMVRLHGPWCKLALKNREL